MTMLDERLRAANDALGEPPHDAPPFDALRRGHRRRQRRGLVAGGAALSIVVVCVAVAFAVRDGRRAPTDSVAPSPTTSPVASRTTTTTPFDGQRLEDMPRLPASAVHVTHLTDASLSGGAVLDDGLLWFISTPPGCTGSCAWLARADTATGRVERLLAPPLEGQGAGPIAIGDGAVFVVMYDYDRSPLRVMRVDLTTRAKRFTVSIPGTSVQGNPKMRIAFDAGAVWLSHGLLPVVKLDPRTGAVLATIPLPPDEGAETTGDVGFAFTRSAVWLVGGTAGTTLIRIDMDTNQATAVSSFGPGFSQSLAADDKYLWTTHFANTNPGARLDLVRVDAADPRVSDVTGIPTTQVAAGDGQVWFVGYHPAVDDEDPANDGGVVGRIDPETMKVVGVTEIAVGVPELFVAGGSAWVYDVTTETITRITTP